KLPQTHEGQPEPASLAINKWQNRNQGYAPRLYRPNVKSFSTAADLLYDFFPGEIAPRKDCPLPAPHETAHRNRMSLQPGLRRSLEHSSYAQNKNGYPEGCPATVDVLFGSPDSSPCAALLMARPDCFCGFDQRSALVRA